MQIQNNAKYNHTSLYVMLQNTSSLEDDHDDNDKDDDNDDDDDDEHGEGEDDVDDV